MNIEDIRKAFLHNVPIEYTAHCQKRMLERDILRTDIKNCILYGEIIEDYPLELGNLSEKSLPSCLILGLKANKREMIHVVVGFNGKKILVISACYPDRIHWMEDNKTRRT